MWIMGDVIRFKLRSCSNQLLELLLVIEQELASQIPFQPCICCHVLLSPTATSFLSPLLQFKMITANKIIQKYQHTCWWIPDRKIIITSSHNASVNSRGKAEEPLLIISSRNVNEMEKNQIPDKMFAGSLPWHPAYIQSTKLCIWCADHISVWVTRRHDITVWIIWRYIIRIMLPELQHYWWDKVGIVRRRPAMWQQLQVWMHASCLFIRGPEEESWTSFSKIISISISNRTSFQQDKMATCHVRSVSWPSSSHPLSVSVEDQLDRLRSSQTPSTSVYQKARGLRVLYERVDDFLQLPLTHQTLSNEQQKERAEEVLNGSLLLLDVCNNTKDVFSMKECFKRLESSLRRRKGGESGIASEIEAYVVSRKQLNKTTRKCFRNLKSMEKKNTSAVDAVGMLRDVKETTLETFQSLLSLVSQPKTTSSSRG